MRLRWSGGALLVSKSWSGYVIMVRFGCCGVGDRASCVK